MKLNIEIKVSSENASIEKQVTTENNCVMDLVRYLYETINEAAACCAVQEYVNSFDYSEDIEEV